MVFLKSAENEVVKRCEKTGKLKWRKIFIFFFFFCQAGVKNEYTLNQIVNKVKEVTKLHKNDDFAV